MERVRYVELDDQENGMADLKKYGTDPSLYRACDPCREDDGRRLKYNIKAILRYPFSRDSRAPVLRSTSLECDYAVPTNLHAWLENNYLACYASMEIVKPYLLMLHTPEMTVTEVESTIGELYKGIQYVCSMYSGHDKRTVVAVLKHMQGAGTLKRLLQHMRDSSCFKVRFLYAWFAGSLRAYIDNIEDWNEEYSCWLRVLLDAIGDKTRVSLLTCLPWTYCMFLLHRHRGHSRDPLISYALNILPICMHNYREVVPSLLSICLVRIVTQFSAFFRDRSSITIQAFEQLGSRVPYDLAETIPLILLLNHRPDVLKRWDDKLLGAALTTCFGWFAREQLLSLTVISYEPMICWHKQGLAFSDRQLVRFAERSDYVAQFIDNVGETLPARQVTLLKQADFQQRMRDHHIRDAKYAKTLQITRAEFLEWSDVEAKKLGQIYEETPAAKVSRYF